MLRPNVCSIILALGCTAMPAALTGCGETTPEPASDRTIVGAWTLDTRTMTDEALRRVDLRLREAARPARAATPPPAAGEGAGGAAQPAQPAANEAAGPSPAEINAAKEKERKRLEAMTATITIKDDGTYMAEYKAKVDDKETRRVVTGEWTLAAGVLVLRETEVMLDSEGTTAMSIFRYQAERARLLSINLRGGASGEVQEVLVRR